MTPAERRLLASVRAELARLERYDDESLVHDTWIRQRYAGGYAATYADARREAVATAWHEAGHAVAALASGARFSSASIRAGGRSAGRVHSIAGGGPAGFVIAAGGQVAEGLRGWTLPSTDAQLRAWLASWRDDGGDARRFRAGLAGTGFGRPGGRADEEGAWRHCVDVLTPLRLPVKELARGLLAWPRHLPYAVAAELAGFSPAPVLRTTAPARPAGASGRGEAAGPVRDDLADQPKAGGRRSRNARTPSA